MKGADVLIASVLILIISITAVFFALQLGGPSTQRTKEVLLMQEGRNNLVSIGSVIKNVLTEGEGSTRVLRFSISGGSYKIDNSTNSITFSMESAAQIIAEGTSKAEDGINFTSKVGIVYLNLSYDNIQIIGENEFGRGYHTLTIRNNGYNETTQKQMIYVSLTPPTAPTLVTFMNQYSQTRTAVLIGTSHSNPNNLNDLGINTYNITEIVENGGQYNYSQTDTANLSGFNTTSVDYLNYLDNQNYNITSTFGQTGGPFIDRYNQTQTFVVFGTNLTSPNYLNSADGQNYNVTESVRVLSWSNQTSDQESGIIQYRGTNTSSNIISTGYTSPGSNIILKGTGWSNPTNAYTNNLLYANAAGAALNSSRYYGFNSGIPLGSTIQRIQVRTHANCSTTTGANQIYVEVYNDSHYSTTARTTGDLGTSETVSNFGTSNDLWGLNWDANDANNIGVNLTAGSSAAGRLLRLEWVSVNITYLNYTYDTEANKSYTTYNNVFNGNLLSNIISIMVTVNTYIYNKTGSAGKNSNPDLWLEMNASNIWVEIGNMSVVGVGNTYVITTNPQILSAWQDANSRDIRIKARYMDANATAWDEINYTAVWVTINSATNYYRAEIEHNATDVSFSGTLDSINASVNFSTNVTSNLNLAIYKFDSDNWDYTPCQSGTANVNTWYKWWCNVTTNPSYYISATGVIRIRLNGTEHLGAALVREDYVQYYVGYVIPTSYANISVEHNSSVILEDPLSVTKINVTTFLKTNTSGTPFGLYIYNFSSNSWEQCSQLSVNNNYAKMECVITSNPSHYISNNIVRIRLNSSGGMTTHQMMEDYLTYQITLPNTHRMEVEHNVTGISFSGVLNNISIPLNFTTNVSSSFNLTLYNFASNVWETCDNSNIIANTWQMLWCNKTGPADYVYGGVISSRLSETSHKNLAEIKEDYIQYYVTYTQ